MAILFYQHLTNIIIPSLDFLKNKFLWKKKMFIYNSFNADIHSTQSFLILMTDLYADMFTFIQAGTAF